MPKTRRHISTKKTENKSSDHIQKKKSTRLKPYQNVISPQDYSNQSEPKSNVRSSKVNSKRNSRVKKQIIRRKEEKSTIERILDKRKGNGDELEYFVKWKGCSDDRNSWESYKNIFPASVVAEYEGRKALERQEQFLSGNKDNTFCKKV